MSRKILVVDDDPHIRDIVRFALEQAGMNVLEAENGADALTRIPAFEPDLIVLDILMPEMNGLDMCRELRKTSELPILFLSSRDDEIDRIIGLEIGGDDYVTKPFSPRELVARVNVILKRQSRSAPAPETSRLLQQGQLQLETESYRVTWKGQPVSLTATEYNLLLTLLGHPNKVYTRDELIGADLFKDIISDRTIDSHVRRLRNKFAQLGCNTVIETVHSFGYKLGACE
jgi:two-component system, OmpR family, response regulator